MLVACVLLGFLTVLGVSAGAASAAEAEYVVRTTADSPPELKCNPSVSKICTLRQIISFENENAPKPSDKVVVPAGTYDLTGPALRISTSVVIAGQGPRQTEISQTSTDRVFDIQAQAVSPPIVEIQGLTIAGGTADASNGSFGGDIRNAGHLTLSFDWITNGSASSGGGISNESGSLIVDHSLVSGNHASSGGGDSGGIQNFGNPAGPSGDAPGHLTVETSTVANNDARLGAGIFSWGDKANETSIINSTIAYNQTRKETSGPERGPGAGLLLRSEDGGTMKVRNTIVANNTEAPTEGQPIFSNCSAPTGGLSSLGFNLESQTDCGFSQPGDLPSTDPQFTTTSPKDNGGDTDTLEISATAPEIDHIPPSAPGCGGTDQRLVTRPIGNGCEPGAYEFSSGPSPPNPPPPAFPSLPAFVPPEFGELPSAITEVITVPGTTSAIFSASINPNGLPTTAHFEYGLETYVSATTEQAVGSDLASHTVRALVTGLLPNSRYHVRAVATNSAGVATGADQAFQTPADPPPAAPVVGKRINVEPISGVVLVRLPSLAKGQGFIRLTENRQLPVGTDVDVRAGTIRLVSAGVGRGKTFTGDFQGGVFRALQSRSRRQRGVTELRLLTSGFPGAPSSSVCATVGKAQAAGASEITAQRHLSSHVLRLLRANAHGNYRTRGTYAAATVRGTRWDTVDRCDGTLTRVHRGIVVVHDIRRQRNIVLHAGQSYLARAPG
jgi:hypothetical protein